MKGKAEIEAEIERLSRGITWRWGECRRFHSNTRKIDLRYRLAAKLAKLENLEGRA